MSSSADPRTSDPPTANRSSLSAVPIIFSKKQVRLWVRSDRPLIRLCHWPGFASGDALEALQTHCGARLLDDDSWPDSARLKEPGPWLWRVHGLDLASAEAVDRLADLATSASESHLLIWTSRRHPWPGLGVETRAPWQLCLGPDEVEALVSDEATARRWFELTEGWPGPLRFLLRHHRDDPLDEGSPGAAALLDWLRPRIEQHLTADQQAVVKLLGFHSVHPEDWRALFAHRPARLSAFELLLRRESLLVPDGHDGVRLPKLLVRALADPASARSGRSVSPDLPLDRRQLDLMDLGRSLGSGVKGTECDSRATKRRARAASRKVDGSRRLGSQELKLRMHFLGPPEVFRARGADDWRPVSWRLHRALHCAAYLALLPDGGCPKDRMIHDLWPNQPRDVVAKNFHPTLSETRKALGGSGTLVHRQGRYSLHEELDIVLDTDQFLELAAQAAREDEPETRLRLLERAWQLYRGPLLEGIDGNWLLALRDRFHDKYIAVLRQAGALALDLQRYTAAMDALRSLLLADPFDEPAHVALIEVYGHIGRRDLVRRQYIKLQDQLKDLRVEPSAEAVSVYHRWMS